jgi:uncharacterized protein YjiS (DUF1127 family)
MGYMSIGARLFGRLSAPSFSSRWAGVLAVRLFDVLVRWQERVRERQNLASLSDAALRDIGLSRADVEHESRKSFWQR